MPTNLKASLKRLHRLKKSESCSSLKYHFARGVMREVVGCLEAHLRKYPNDRNFLWVDVAWIVDHTLKVPDKSVGMKERKQKNLTYGRWMVEKALLFARESGIISRPFEEEVDGDVRRGFVLTPHDALCKRTKTGCQFVGPYQIPGTSWHTEVSFRDGKPTNKRTIVFTGFLGWGTDAGKGRGKGQGKDEGKENDLRTGHGNRDVEIAENSRVIQKLDVNSQPEIGLFPISPLSLLNPNIPFVSQSSKEREAIAFNNDSNSENRTPSSRSLSGLLTDENRKAQPSASRDIQTVNESSAPPIVDPVRGSAATVTVGQHFQDAADFVDVVTDRELDRSNNSLDSFRHWDELEAAVREAVKRNAPVPLTDRKTLAMLMGATIDVLAERFPPERPDPARLFPRKPEQFYPKPWLRIMNNLKRGGALRKPELSTDELWKQFVSTVGKTEKYEAASIEQREAMWDEYERAHERT